MAARAGARLCQAAGPALGGLVARRAQRRGPGGGAVRQRRAGRALWEGAFPPPTFCRRRRQARWKRPWRLTAAPRGGRGQDLGDRAR